MLIILIVSLLMLLIGTVVVVSILVFRFMVELSRLQKLLPTSAIGRVISNVIDGRKITLE